MGFPVPGDVIEQSLDLNRHLVLNPAATFLMRVEGDLSTAAGGHPGELLVVDRSLAVQDQALIVGILEGQMQVLRVLKQGTQLVPAFVPQSMAVDSLELWGVITTIIRRV